MDDKTLYDLFGSLSSEIGSVSTKLSDEIKDVKSDVKEVKDAQGKLDRTLRRAIRLAVLDARRQRKRNAEFDEKMTQLASAQLLNEEGLADLREGMADLRDGLADLKNTVKTFIDGLQKGNNGHGGHEFPKR